MADTAPSFAYKLILRHLPPLNRLYFPQKTLRKAVMLLWPLFPYRRIITNGY